MNNAVEALTKGGNIYFKTRHRSTPIEGIQPRGFVEVTVSDDGPGISEEMKRRMFEPFVSSKGGGHAGLGLSIVLNLIDGLNGSLVCQSEEGTGTHFKVELLMNRECVKASGFCLKQRIMTSAPPAAASRPGKFYKIVGLTWYYWTW